MDERWLQLERQDETRGSSATRIKRAWRSLGISTLLLAIAAMTYSELRSAQAGQMRVAYIWILWLFIGRFAWCVWKYLRARRDAHAFRSGVERQLRVADTPRDRTAA